LQKLFTVYLAYMAPADVGAFVPQLDKKENDHWRWVPLEEMLEGDIQLHPVADMVVNNSDNLLKVQEVFSAAGT